jgi:hypothetical protein
MRKKLLSIVLQLAQAAGGEAVKEDVDELIRVVKIVDRMREKAEEAFKREEECYDEDRVRGGDMIVYEACIRRAVEAVRNEVLCLLGYKRCEIQ